MFSSNITSGSLSGSLAAEASKFLRTLEQLFSS